MKRNTWKVILVTAVFFGLVGPFLGCVTMFAAFGGFENAQLAAAFRDLGIYLLMYYLPALLFGGPFSLVVGVLGGMVFALRATRSGSFRQLRTEMLAIGAVLGTSLPLALRLFDVPLPMGAGLVAGIVSGALSALILTVLLKAAFLQLVGSGKSQPQSARS